VSDRQTTAIAPYAIADQGPGLGPFHADFSLPNIDFSWTNRNQFSFSKPDGLTVSWTVADPTAGHIMIFGILALDGSTSGATLFTCTEQSAKGTFTVPSQVLPRAGIWSGRFNELRPSVFHSVRCAWTSGAWISRTSP
jgi:hypothetical protein